ncbi:unnamed protein product [Echinostoma caproni]|uniref:peptidylprolyl isomerase n=1 Tax=Echinostoma caproni TaxID=27848 RepID=A0A183B5R8_9TREM|nr:unnamed protein product [Echinostoma caproni]
MGRHKKRVSSKSGTFNEVTTLSPTTDEVEAPLTVTSVSNATNPATEMTVVAPEDNTKEEIWPGGDIKSDEVVDTTTARESVPLNESEPIEHEIPVDEHNANHDNDDTIANVDGESSEKLDILGNGLITKQVVEKGLGRETRPNHGDVVTVSYQCWLDEDGTLVEDMPELTFTLGDGDVIHALDLAIPLAELKEKFELIADARFAYGVRGREPDIPGNARLRYHVRLLASDDPPQYTTMSGKERLTVADQKREKGNYYFRREEYESAMNSYMKALKILSPDSVDQTEVDPATTTASPVDVSPDCFHEMDTLILKLHNNLAATQLKVIYRDFPKPSVYE